MAPLGPNARWAAILLLVGCEEDSVCEVAADKLEWCKFSDAAAEQGFARLPLTVARDDCTGLNQCVARCVAPASCGDIRALAFGSSTDPNSKPVSLQLGNCILACIEMSEK